MGADTIEMTALTVRQPWAWAIAAGHKAVENRTWTTRHRGLLAIHAGTRWDEDEVGASRFVRDTVKAQGGTMPRRWRDAEPHIGTGVVVAVARIAGICAPSDLFCQCGLWARLGQYHWHLADVRMLPDPVPARGRQQLWTVTLPASVARSAEAVTADAE